MEDIEANGMDVMIEVHTQALYDEIFKAMEVFDKCESYGLRPEATMYTKYKTVAKKVKPVATQLPSDTDKHIKQVEKEPSLRRSKKIGHKFSKETLASLKIGGDGFLIELEKKKFQKMFSKHGKVFPSSPDESGCIHPNVVAPMVIFTVPHVP